MIERCRGSLQSTVASSGHETSASKRFLIYNLRFNCLFQLWEDTAKSLQVTAKGILQLFLPDEVELLGEEVLLVEPAIRNLVKL